MIFRTNHFAFISIFALLLVSFLAVDCLADGPAMKFAPKGAKKLMIGVLDPNAGIEAAAQINKRHKAEAEKRGWDVRFVDLHDNIAMGASQMENMIAANYDGIIIHWMPLRSIDKQIKMAFDKGIPVISLISQGSRTPGIVAEIGFMEATHGAMLAEYLGNKLKPNDKIVTVSIPMLEKHEIQLAGFKAIADKYKLDIVQNLQYQFTGAPYQWAYEQITNVLLADSKNEIKGIYVSTDGLGIPMARAVQEKGRDDIIVVMSDDSPNLYAEIQKLPQIQAVVTMRIEEPTMNQIIFDVFDKVFSGESVVSQKWYPILGQLMTRDKLPPAGYAYDVCQDYDSHQPDL